MRYAQTTAEMGSHSTGPGRSSQAAQVGAAEVSAAATHAAACKRLCRQGSASQRHGKNANRGSFGNRVAHDNTFRVLIDSRILRR
jgi:hypothetical protein